MTKGKLLEIIKDCDDSTEVEILIIRQSPKEFGDAKGFWSYFSTDTTVELQKDIHNETKVVFSVNVED